MKKLFTSESVGAGHADKICDQIADKILDSLLNQDQDSRVAVEVLATKRLIVISGEIKTKAYVDFTKEAWSVLKPLGYNELDFSIFSCVNNQSEEINKSVDTKEGLKAGDQGIMFGYATNETKSFMPLPIVLAHEIVKKAEKLRKEGIFKNAKSDMKSQVTIDYSDQSKIFIDTILLSIQHTKNYDEKEFKKFIKKEIIIPILKEYNLDQRNYNLIINPSKKFTIGGPISDAGLTGRKIIVDTYGGFSRHGGGSFSGKDYTKVDRSAAYAARWVAKNIVASKLADKCEIQLSFAIGMSEPISVFIETFDTEKIPKEKIIEIIEKVFDLSVEGIIKNLELKTTKYFPTATFGHFGRDDLDLPWERTNKIFEIKKYLDLKKI